MYPKIKELEEYEKKLNQYRADFNCAVELYCNELEKEIASCYFVCRKRQPFGTTSETKYESLWKTYEEAKKEEKRIKGDDDWDDCNNFIFVEKFGQAKDYKKLLQDMAIREMSE